MLSMLLNVYGTDHKAWRHYDDYYIFKQIFSFKNIILLASLTICNKQDTAISSWKPFNFLISFIQFMLHLVETIKRVIIFFLLLILLGIFFAKHENSLQLFPFKVLPSSLWNGNLPNGDPFSQKHRLRPCQPGTLSLSTASQYSHIIRAKLCLTLNYKPLA